MNSLWKMILMRIGGRAVSLEFCKMLLALMLALFSIQPSFADDPYYSQSEVIRDREGAKVTIKLMHGYELFVDPVRGVVVDEKGNLLAASPMSRALFLWCEGKDKSKQCWLYDEIYGTVFQPNLEGWKASEVVEKQGRALIFPGEIKKEFGFISRSASIFEIIKFETLAVAHIPRRAGLVLLWWTLIFICILPMIIRLKANNWKFGELSFSSVFNLTVRVTGIAIMVLFAGVIWLMVPYSIYFLVFVLMLSAGLVLALMNLRKTLRAAN